MKFVVAWTTWRPTAVHHILREADVKGFYARGGEYEHYTTFCGRTEKSTGFCAYPIGGDELGRMDIDRVLEETDCKRCLKKFREGVVGR